LVIKGKPFSVSGCPANSKGNNKPKKLVVANKEAGLFNFNKE
jgi:hypothetical protein